MASLDEIFCREFTEMQRQLRGRFGGLDLKCIPLPPDAVSKFRIEKHERVILSDITEKYYSVLSGTEAGVWNGGKLKKRRFDHAGNFLRDSDGRYQVREVTLPSNCVGLISDKRIGVPTRFESKEGFSYVDMVNVSGSANTINYLYIVPKKYCYRLNQVALVLSWTRLKKYYMGVSLALTTGHILYMYLVPYRPSCSFSSYRVLHCKTSCDFTEELKMLRDFWVKRHVIFNPADCVLRDTCRGRSNMAVEELNGVLEYVRFDSRKPLGSSSDDCEFENGMVL